MFSHILKEPIRRPQRGQVPVHIRRQRNDVLGQLSEVKRKLFYERHQGETRSMLVEHGHSNMELTGYTDNYIKVSLPYDETLINQVVSVELGHLMLPAIL